MATIPGQSAPLGWGLAARAALDDQFADTVGHDVQAPRGFRHGHVTFGYLGRLPQ